MDLTLSRPIVLNWARIVLGSICYYFEKNKELIGDLDEHGLSKIVEMVKSLFFKPKYFRGRIRDQNLYVGSIERVTSNIFVEGVERRDIDILKKIINSNM